jgi:tetratricopeptide (TPR) repeat protein
MRTKYVDAAVEKYKNALVFSSNPDLYMEMGNCLSRRLRYDEAIQAYTIASSIEPHRFAPKFGLMKIYGFAKDTLHANAIAQQIVDMKPKVESKKVANYKKEAKKVLENYELNQLAYGK